MQGSMAGPSRSLGHEDDRQQRLLAIAQLEEQHRMRRSGLEAGTQSDLNSPHSGKHFLLMVSKGSGSLAQRANQDRAQTMLTRYPHWILDGSNSAFIDKRNELFDISKQRGKYPQLFLVDSGTTTFIGDFEVIEMYNEEGSLGALVNDSPTSTPSKRNSIVDKFKGLVMKTMTKKDKASPSILSSDGAVSGSSAISESPSTRISASDLLVSGVPTEKSPAILPTPRKSSRKNLDVPVELPPAGDGTDEKSAIPVSKARPLVAERSDGHIPLAGEEDENPETGEQRLRSRSHSGRESKRSTSKSRSHEEKISSRRSSSGGKYKKSEGDGEREDHKAKRSSSVGTLRESTKTLGSEKSGSTTLTRPRSRGKLRDSTTSSTTDELISSRGTSKSRGARSRSRGREGDRSKSPRSRRENGEGSMDIKESDADRGKDKSKTRSKSRSKRSTRPGLTVDANEDSGLDKKEKRPHRNSIVDDDTPPGSPSKGVRRGARIREPESEKTRSSRKGSRSASPKRREIVRSTSPGAYGGDMARKRDAVKEYRERKSAANNGENDVTRQKKLPSTIFSRVGGGSLHTRMPSHVKDESLSDLVKRVRDKDKERHEDQLGNSQDLPTTSVHW